MVEIRSAMALIDTEEAAKRLARVILSDIALYSRERPQPGENPAAQIEEGRRLFGSRVTPAFLPLFDAVLADRRAANGKTPVEVEMSSVPASPLAEPIAVVRSPADNSPTPRPIVDTRGGERLPVAPVPFDFSVPAALATAAPAALATVAPAAVPAAAPAALATVAPAKPFAVVAGEPEAPVPVLTSRISVPRLLALMAVVVAAFVFLIRFAR
jgi:hypothetical protein